MYVLSKWVLALCSLTLMSAAAHAQNVHGILRVVKGDVQIKSSSGKTAKARIGEKVFPKDVIVTGKDARAKIVMVDNNEINVSPESQVEIQHYEYNPAEGKKDVLLNVIYGKVRSKVEQKYDGKTTKFQIKTPSAVAGVRGTDFMTGYNPTTKVSTVTTFQGRVEFGLPGPGGTISNIVAVTPGNQASSAGSAAPTAPTPVPKEELAKRDNESRAEPVAAAPANDPRTPAAEPAKEKKEDAPKTDGAKTEGGEKKAPGAAPAASGSGGSASNGSATSKDGSAVPGSTGTRAPAAAGPSTGSGSMFTNSDFAGGAGNTAVPVVNTPNVPTTSLPPVLTGTTPTTIGCDIACQNAVQKKTTLNITVH